MSSQEDGQQNHTNIVNIIKTHGEQLGNNLTHLKFKCSINDDQFEEVIIQ